MALPIIAGVVRCAASGVVPSGQRWVNVHHARFKGGVSNPSAADITALDALLARLYAGSAFGTGVAWVTSQCSPGCQFLQMAYTPLDGTSLTSFYPKSGAGVLSPSSPSECAPVLTLRSATRGRSNRGRVYLPAPGSTVVDANGRLGTGTAANTVSQYAGILSALGGPLVTPFWELGVASYLHATFAPIVVATMDTNIDVQRRRKM